MPGILKSRLHSSDSTSFKSKLIKEHNILKKDDKLLSSLMEEN